MRLENRLRLYLLALHLGLAYLVFRAYSDEPPLFLAAEILFLISLIFGWRFISALFVPLRLIETGTELIDERDFTSTFVTVGQPEMDRLIKVYNRMIGALREERRHGREQEDFLSRLIEASPAGVVICDLDGAILRTNPAAQRLLGWPEEPTEDTGDPADSEAKARDSLEPASENRRVKLGELDPPWGEVLAAIDSGGSRVLALDDARRIRCRPGELRDHGFQRRFLILEELTEELRLSEKAAYEKLIRMVSHEVNNSVGAVNSLLGSLGHYQEQLVDEDRSDFSEALEIGTGRLERLRAFIDAFADLVRLPEPDRRPLDLGALLDDLLKLYGPALEARSIRLIRERHGELPALRADIQQLEQALINVIENAADAIGERGTITVRSAVHATLQIPILQIDDSGPGLDPAQTEELFTPFFTTKPEGQGLGLTLVKEVLSRHGYVFTLRNRPAGGCRFEVRFLQPATES